MQIFSSCIYQPFWLYRNTTNLSLSHTEGKADLLSHESTPDRSICLIIVMSVLSIYIFLFSKVKMEVLRNKKTALQYFSTTQLDYQVTTMALSLYNVWWPVAVPKTSWISFSPRCSSESSTAFVLVIRWCHDRYPTWVHQRASICCTSLMLSSV